MTLMRFHSYKCNYCGHRHSDWTPTERLMGCREIMANQIRQLKKTIKELKRANGILYKNENKRKAGKNGEWHQPQKSARHCRSTMREDFNACMKCNGTGILAGKEKT